MEVWRLSTKLEVKDVGLTVGDQPRGESSGYINLTIGEAESNQSCGQTEGPQEKHLRPNRVHIPEMPKLGAGPGGYTPPTEEGPRVGHLRPIRSKPTELLLAPPPASHNINDIIGQQRTGPEVLRITLPMESDGPDSPTTKDHEVPRNDCKGPGKAAGGIRLAN